MSLSHLLVVEISQILLSIPQVQYRLEFKSRMNEYLCPFYFLQFMPLLAVHASILLMDADWSGTDWRLITTRDLLMASEAEAESETLS